MASCHPDRKNYARGACRSCYNMAYALTHKEERRRDRASWYRRKGRAYNAAYHLEHAHGITVIERETMLRAQGGICAICGAPENGRPLSVDHDHATGHIRGLLCIKCNAALERLETCGPDWAKEAIAYITRGHATVTATTTAKEKRSEDSRRVSIKVSTGGGPG